MWVVGQVSQLLYLQPNKGKSCPIRDRLSTYTPLRICGSTSIPELGVMSAGEVKLKMPKLRKQTFETAIIERYRRRESSIEESLI